MTGRAWLSRSLLVLYVVGMSLLLQGSQCVQNSVGPPLDKVTTAFDNAISSLSANSTNWQATLQGLENNMIQQGQQTLANQVQSVIARGVATTSGEFRCDVAFLAVGLSDALKVILATFKGQSPPPAPPHTCTIDPSAIDLGIAPAQRPATLNIYGFNLNASNISVAVVNTDGSRITPPPGMFSIPTEFMATFNIHNYAFTQTNSYLSVTLTPGGENRISIVQAPSCGSLSQPCCTTGAQCVSGAGCSSNLCVTCPPPSTPVTTILFSKSNEFAGNNCGGQNVDRTYGGMCSNGFHREQCQVTTVDSCGSECNAAARWANSNSADCTCIVHFNTPSDCFKGIHVNINITQTSNTTARPTGC
jgi:hypothetical protein